MLGALGCGSCIYIVLHLAAELFVVLGRVLLLLLVIVAWVTCVSEIIRAKRMIALAPSRLRLGLCRASDALVCGVPSCLLGVFSEVVLGFPTEVDVRVCLRLARLGYVRLADTVDSLALLRMVEADEGVKGLRVL
jgi:hypothetical protein